MDLSTEELIESKKILENRMNRLGAENNSSKSGWHILGGAIAGLGASGALIGASKKFGPGRALLSTALPFLGGVAGAKLSPSYSKDMERSREIKDISREIGDLHIQIAKRRIGE